MPLASSRGWKSMPRRGPDSTLRRHRLSWSRRPEAGSHIRAYNPRRLHSAMDSLLPTNYESKNRVRSLRGKHGLPTFGDCVAGATPPVDIHGRPQFARRSHVHGQQEKVADIHPAFRRARRFGPDGMRWLAPQQPFELEARYPRKARPATVLPVLPSTINCQSNLRKELLVCQWPAVGATRQPAS